MLVKLRLRVRFRVRFWVGFRVMLTVSFRVRFSGQPFIVVNKKHDTKNNTNRPYQMGKNEAYLATLKGI